MAGRRFVDFDCGMDGPVDAPPVERLLAANTEIKSRMDEVEEFVALHCLGMMGEPNPVRGWIDGGQA